VRTQTATDCGVNVHLLAHSTGAYVVREAFDDADDRKVPSSVKASQIALVGGDISAGSLMRGNSETESIFRHCVGLTNYSNPFDEVLQLSNVKRVGLAPRVGRVEMPDNAPSASVNVDSGDDYQEMIRVRNPATIIGTPSR
jgi:esterase/lipase superfamily enzyme